jgi:hypothetical protein
MKTTGLTVLVSFLALSGLALASQSGAEKDHSSMMQEMMKGKQSDKGGMHGMGDMSGMMGMMKMMQQCAAMMQSADADGGGAKESQKQ